MRPGARVTVTVGRYQGRTGVISEAADADGVFTVRLESPGDWPFPELASVMGRYLEVVPKLDPMDSVGEALV
jgi:hypothetical protein